MSKSNKPVVWGLFAAGGTLTAFVTPVLVVLTLLAATGHVPALLAYDRMHAFAAQWIGKAALFGIVFLWQIPHFLAIAWLYREDYARAGLPLLPVVEPDGRSTGRQSVAFAAALLPMSLTPARSAPAAAGR